MSRILLETKNLRKYFKTPYGRLHAVDGISLSIEEGTTLGVVGESGCGKSTLARTICRILDPTAGQILYKGQDITWLNRRKMKPFRREIQMIFQDPYSSLNPRMSVEQLIAEPVLINRVEKEKAGVKKRVKRLMDTVGLASRLANAYPHELDGGRRQRIGVARALSVDPRFVICDEPVSALDVSIQAQILNLLMDLQEEFNLTYMFITHDMSVVKHITNKIMVMHLGECVEKADTETLFARQFHPYTKALISSIPEPDLDEESRSEIILRGEIVSPIEPEDGKCRFRSRCQIGFMCPGDWDNELFEVEKDHFCSCRKSISDTYQFLDRRWKTLVLKNIQAGGKEGHLILANGKVLMLADTGASLSEDFRQIDCSGCTVKYGELDDSLSIDPESVEEEIREGMDANLLIHSGEELLHVFVKGQMFTAGQIAFKAALAEIQEKREA